MSDGGTYALVIALGIGLRLRVGRLGVAYLPSGYYVYVGSALGGLSGRLRRHLALDKQLHWHIDYLLREAAVAQVWYAFGHLRLECAWNAIVTGLPGAESSIPRFGSSDCRCSSHLTYFPALPSSTVFKNELTQRGLPQACQLNLAQQTDGPNLAVWRDY